MSQFPEQPRQQRNFDQGDYNFAQGPAGQPYDYDFGLSNQQPQQVSRSQTGIRRTLFLGCGCVTAAIVVVCACLFGIMYTTREAIPALMWIQMASGSSPLDLDDATDFDIICENSQAELFTQRFLERYPGEVNIELDQNTIISESDNSDANTVGFEGVMTYAGEELPYEAVFYVDPDGESFIFFLGCIERIDQISPPLSVELEPEGSNGDSTDADGPAADETSQPDSDTNDTTDTTDDNSSAE